ncbi:MAG: 5-oxoprolinase, partial [Acidobacteria bacterium]
EREGDLGAQIAACHTGAERLREVCARYGLQRTHQAARELLDYSEEMMREFLKRVPPGSYRAEDFLDNDGISQKPIRLAVEITFGRDRGRGRPPHTSVVRVDFTGSDPQVAGSVNAVEAITYSACFYVFRCLLREDVPATTGLMRPIHLIAPP